MGIVDEILSNNGGQLAAALTKKAGFSAGEAQRFLPLGIGRVVEVVKAGGADVGTLLSGGGAASLLARVDAGSLASASGIEAAKATSGLQALLPLLLSALRDKAGSAEGIAALLGGGSGAGATGAVGNLAGKLFKR